MKFITTVFGDEYVPFLTVFLESVKRIYPSNEVIVGWNDIKETEVFLLKEHFNNVDFRKIDIATDSDVLIERIPMKMRFWTKLLEEQKDGETIVLIDVDTIIYKNFDSVIGSDFDMIFTYKNEKFPINTGVVVVKASKKIKDFFTLWSKENETIINDTELLQKAYETYGAADQQSLVDLMQTTEFSKDFTRTFDFGDIHFKPVECNILNQTNSVPMNIGSFIFHYKAGWHPILLKEEGFSEYRSIENSYEMYTYWINMFAETNKAMLENLVVEASKEQEKKLDWKALPFEHRGIPHSEMLAVIATAKKMGVEIFIESGRCRGQSTMMLAEGFKDTSINTVSIEWIRDENADFAENRLKPYKNLELLYGDAHQLLPQILEQHKGKKIGILLDGPKSVEAFELLSKCVNNSENNIVVGFVHDLNMMQLTKISKSRVEIEKYFDRVFYTDNTHFVSNFSHLDKDHYVDEDKIDMHSFRPYYKGFDYIQSYGPTVGIVFPTKRDKIRYAKMHAHSNIMQENKDGIKSTIKKLVPKSMKKLINRLIK